MATKAKLTAMRDLLLDLLTRIDEAPVQEGADKKTIDVGGNEAKTLKDIADFLNEPPRAAPPGSLCLDQRQLQACLLGFAGAMAQLSAERKEGPPNGAGGDNDGSKDGPPNPAGGD